jgi:hypothetical protein
MTPDPLAIAAGAPRTYRLPIRPENRSRSGLGSDCGAAAEYGGELVSRVDLELAEDAGEVALDRAGGDEEGLGDLAVCQALAGELGDAAFAGGQRVESSENDPPWARTGGAELGLGVSGEASGSRLVGAVECLAEQLSRLGTAIAPTEQRAEVGERSRSFQSGPSALEVVNGGYWRRRSG